MKIRNSGGESLVKYERQNPFSIIALPRNALNVSLFLSRFRFFPSWHNPLSRYRRRFFPPLSAVASHRIGRSDNDGISFWRGRDASHSPPLSVVRSRVSVKVEYREHGEKLLKLTPPPKKLFFRTFRYFETGPPTGDFPLPMFTRWTRFSRYQSYECVSFLISRNRSEEKSSSSYERIHLNSEFFLVESLSCTRGNCSELYITRNVNRDDFYTLTFAYLAQQCLLIFVEILLFEMVIEERDYFLSLFFLYISFKIISISFEWCVKIYTVLFDESMNFPTNFLLRLFDNYVRRGTKEKEIKKNCGKKGEFPCRSREYISPQSQ